MSSNHLIIGIGGTGRKVLRELRKRVYEEFNSNEPPKDKACLEYLYVDSSEGDLNERGDWKVLGTSVHLADTQKVSIHGINGDILNNLNQYPGLQSFLPNGEVGKIKEKIGPLIEQGIGGQRRRLGRILLANNLSCSDGRNDFITRLQGAVRRLTALSGEAPVSFHICAGLAGGTGSGSIVDIIAQIRKQYSSTCIGGEGGGKSYPITLYLYMPEMQMVNPVYDEQGFYQANGYAALSELNAISVHRYRPLDITGNIDSNTQKVRRLLDGEEPFEAAYLYSNVNEAARMLDINHDLPAAVADFIFQRTVASTMVENDGQMLRLVGCENDGAGAEIDNANQATRSRKFLSFGIKRVEYPETEIKEYATYKFTQQTARQFAFNKWDGLQGFIELPEEEIGIGFFSTDIKNKETRETLKLSDSYLILEKPLIDNQETSRWRPIHNNWENRTTSFADNVMYDTDKKSWINEFSKKVEEYYNRSYRTHGVKDFYAIQRKERSGYAKIIRRHIENKLFDEWATGSKSIIEINKYISFLIQDCGERIEEFQKRTKRAEEHIEKEINTNIREVREDWRRINWVLDSISKSSRKRLEEYREYECDLYIAQTQIEGYRYAQELLYDIIQELNLAKQGVENFKSILSEIIEEVTKQADSRCKRESIVDANRTLKKYNPEQVQGLVKTYISAETMQRENAAAIRNEMIKALGDGDHSFANLCDKTDKETTLNMMLRQCTTKAEQAMEDSARQDPIYKMVRVNILEKLKQELTTSEKREEFVRNLIESASCFVQLDPTEIGGANGGTMRSMVQLCIPKFDDDATKFRDALIEEFQRQCPGFDPRQDVAENYKENQIVVVSAKAGFPLRYLANTKVLKQKYEELLANPNRDLNKILLHGETFEEPLPSLYELGRQEIRYMVEKPVMLAYAMGLIKEDVDPTTGGRREVIDLPTPELEILKQANLTFLGRNILDTIEMLSNDYDLAKRIIDREKKEFTRYRTNNDKKRLRDALSGVLDRIKQCPECGNNVHNELYRRYQAIAVELVQNELADK